MKNVNFVGGKYKQQFQYKSFTPSLINRAFSWSDARIDVTYASASTLAKSFEEIGIFKEITGFKRNRLFLFDEYLNLFSRNE